MGKEQVIQKCIDFYRSEEKQFRILLNAIRDVFEIDPPVNEKNISVIHSLKYRIKDPTHLEDKLVRKWSDDKPINVENLFSRVTDLAGLRILHLYQDQFPIIHDKIMEKIDLKDWYFAEPPKAYTWDPETVRFFKGLGIPCEQKESYYTSIHYLVKLKENSSITCEIQVRTLFEEIWGEIDHSINYPNSIDSIACKEQIRVLSKLVSTGTRLADSIFRTYNDYMLQFKEETKGGDSTQLSIVNTMEDTSETTSETPLDFKVVRQYLLGGNSNWFNQVKEQLSQVKTATFMWPNGYWPFEKLAPAEKPESGDIFVVGYGKADELIIGEIIHSGIKQLTDIISEDLLIGKDRVNSGFKDANELRKFVNNRREIGCITIENTRIISIENYDSTYEDFKIKYTVRENSLFIFKKK